MTDHYHILSIKDLTGGSLLRETIERQVSLVMNGSEFGDAHLSRFMTRELQSRLREAELSGR